MHIITVCTANICRSPFAQLLLQHRLGRAATVASGGVRALTGAEMDPRSRAALTERGIEGHGLDDFRASPLTERRIADSDLVLTATLAHRDVAIRMTPRALKRTFTLLEFASVAERVEATSAPELISAVARGRGRLTGPVDITDPVGLEFAGYEAVMAELDHVIGRIADRLRPLLDASRAGGA